MNNGSVNDLAPYRYLAIIITNDGLVYRLSYMSLGIKVLNTEIVGPRIDI